MMKLGIFAKTFDGTDAATVLRAARDAGFVAVQFNMSCCGLASMPESINPSETRRVADAARSTGVAIAAVSGTYNMIHPDPAVRALGLMRLRTLAAACAAMHTRLITLCTGTRDPQDQWRAHPDNDSTEAWHDLITQMIEACAIAEEFDVELGIEPELANVVSSAAKARKLIDELNTPRLRIVLDAANLFEVETAERRRSIVAEAIDLLADRITLAHAKDRTESGGFIAAGSGVLDYPHYIACLRRAGFAGPLVTHGLTAAEAPEVGRFLTRALAAA
jgi:sugar phosphate isomerase/epimerase